MMWRKLLITSMVFVSLEVAGVGLMSFREMGRSFVRTGELSAESWWLLIGLMALSGLVGFGALWVGARHFERLEH